MSIPIKHHHLPVFYLKRWAGRDGKLCEFSKPHNDVIANRKSPRRTGFVERLYETPGLPHEEAQKVEQRFMAPVDSLGAQALAALESNDTTIATDSRLRSAWSRFIMSLLMRTPEDIAALKGGVAEEWMRAVPGLETAYASRRGPNDPATFAEYFVMRGSDELDRWAMELAPQLMDHAGIGTLLNSMRWLVRRINSSDAELLTSDRPVVMSATLAERNAYIFLPIGPKAFFAAVSDDETRRIVESRDPAEHANPINELVARHARRFVYARDARSISFVSQFMGTRRHRSLIERLVASRRGGS
jgi:hypothetical protein